MRTSSRDFAILLFDEVEALDVAAVARVASGAGRHWNWRPFRVLNVAREPGWVETRSQLRLEATVALSDCPAPELLLVPGGYGARRAAGDAEIVEWCAAAGARASLVAAIGAGAAVLGAAGLLDGAAIAKRTPSNGWLEEAIPGAAFSTSRIEWSGETIVTATDGVDAVELALALVERVLGARLASSLKHEMGLDEEPRRIELSVPPELDPTRSQ